VQEVRPLQGCGYCCVGGCAGVIVERRTAAAKQLQPKDVYTKCKR
jgi:hypothetical protein